MIHDVVAATYKGDYRIELRFNDGAGGVVDFSGYLDRAGIFERFKDIEFFKQFKINEDLGTLTWDNEIDIAPETLYAEATGAPLPHWMEKKRKHPANKSMQPTRYTRG